jgi:hypothetical protein
MNFIMLNIGKILFPNLPLDLRRRRMNVVAATVITSVALAGVMVVVLTKMGKFGGN